MPSLKIIKLKGKDIEVRELTVEQLDEVMGADPAMSTIDRVFNPDMVSEQMIALSTGLEKAEMRSCTPSDLRPIVDAVKEVNSDFLAGMKSLVVG